jgi:hypothetical protein
MLADYPSQREAGVVVAEGEGGSISLMAVDEEDIMKAGDEDEGTRLIAKEEDDLQVDAVARLRVEVPIMIEVHSAKRPIELTHGRGTCQCRDMIRPMSGSNQIERSASPRMPALLVRTMQNLGSGVNRIMAGTRPSKFVVVMIQTTMDGLKGTPV